MAVKKAFSARKHAAKIASVALSAVLVAGGIPVVASAQEDPGAQGQAGQASTRLGAQANSTDTEQAEALDTEQTVGVENQGRIVPAQGALETPALEVLETPAQEALTASVRMTGEDDSAASDDSDEVVLMASDFVIENGVLTKYLTV